MNLPQRILVIRLSAMGDVAMCVPVFLALHKKYLSVEVIMLSRKRFKSILQPLPNVHFIEAQVDDVHKGVLGLWKLSKALKSQHIDAVADLHDVLRSRILRTFLSKSLTAVINKGRSDKKKLVRDATFFKPLKHTTQRYADVFRELGFEIDLANDFLQKRTVSNQIHEKIGKNTSKWIGFAPFAAHRTKALGIEKATEIAQEIMRLENVQVLLFGGGKKEIQLLDQIAQKTGAINLAGQFNFDEELDLISNLDAMIAMDSGNGHLAAMYGIPVVTLWGNTHPYAGFAPYAQPIENQITVDRTAYPLVPTSIFGKTILDGYEDITDYIETRTVINRLKGLISVV